MNIELLERQHQDIRQTIQDIETVLQEDYVKFNAFDVALKVGKLSGKLTLHLKTEDEVIFPKLIQTKAESLLHKGTDFNRKIVPVANQFTNYKTTYMNASVIKSNPRQFIQDSQGIFTVLKTRLLEEDHEFYPLLREI